MRNTTYLFIALTCLSALWIGCVMMHDNGIPDSISETEKAFVLEMTESLTGQTELITQKMMEFTAQPENETALGAELEVLVLKYWKDGEQMNDPIFYVPFPEEAEAVKRFQSSIATMEAAVDEMIPELLRRSAEGIHDQQCYDKLEVAFRRGSDLPDDIPCTPSECKWCRAKYNLTRFFANQWVARQK